jgi:hypothetical protein
MSPEKSEARLSVDTNREFDLLINKDDNKVNQRKRTMSIFNKLKELEVKMPLDH